MKSSRYFFFALFLCVLGGCNPSFDESSRDQDGATFAVDRVKSNRLENQSLNDLGLPTQVLIEFSTNVTDIGLEIPLPNEPFEIISEKGNKKVSTDFSGNLLFSYSFEVNPSLLDQEILFPIEIRALGSHRGSVKLLIKVRPWQEGDSQVLDTRFQGSSEQPEKLARKIKNEETLALNVDEVEITQTGSGHNTESGFFIDHDLQMSFLRDFRIIIEPEIFTNANATQLADDIQVPSGNFKVHTYLIAYDKSLPMVEDLQAHLNSCLPECLLAKNTHDREVNGRKISSPFHIEVPQASYAHYRYTSMLFLVIEPENPDIKSFAGYGVWTTPTRLQEEVELERIPENVEQILLNTNSVQRIRAEKTESIDINILAESNEAQPISDKMKVLWNLNDKSLENLLAMKSNTVSRYVNSTHCELKEKEPQYERNIWNLFKGQSIYTQTNPYTDEDFLPENMNCQTEQVEKKLTLKYFDVIHEVKSFEVIGSPGRTAKLDIMDTLFRESRNSRGQFSSQSEYLKGFGEVKVGVSFNVFQAYGVGQYGYGLTEAKNQSNEENRRQRNGAILIREYIQQEWSFNLVADLTRCVILEEPESLVMTEKEKPAIHCQKFEDVSVEDTWYIMYAYFHSGEYIFGHNPFDRNQAEMAFHYRGYKNHRDFSTALSELAKGFDTSDQLQSQEAAEFYPVQVNAIWAGYVRETDQALMSGELLRYEDRVIEYDGFRPIVPHGPPSGWRLGGMEGLQKGLRVRRNNEAKALVHGQ